MDPVGAIRRAWARYVDFWREVEAPEALAIGRISFGLAAVINLVHQALGMGLLPLYAIPADGGIWPAQATPGWSLFSLFPPTATAVHAVWAASLAAAVGLTLGLFTRLSALVLMVCTMTLAGRLGWSVFGADSVFRVMGFLMVLAPAGAAWSLDALRTGPRAQIPAWPRRLILAQITLIYVITGIVKFGSTWTFLDGWSALYYALNIPAFARWPGDWAATFYPLTQLATFVTGWWEIGFFVLPLLLFLRRHPGRGGTVRHRLVRYDPRPLFLGIGVVLHLSLALTMELGMFPWVMMALYPFFLQPDEARALVARLGLGRGPQPAPASPSE